MLFLLNLFQKIHDFLLHRNIQRACCFIANQQRRMPQQCSGNTDSLAFPSADLRWIFGEIAHRKVHTFQNLFTLPFSFCFRNFSVIKQCVIQILPNRHLRIQGRFRILKNHLHFFSNFFLRPFSGNLFSFQVNASFRCRRNACQDLYDCTFTASAVSNQPQTLSRHHFKTDVF